MISYEQYLQFSPYFAQQDIEKEEGRLRFFKSFDILPQTIKSSITSMDTAEKIMNMGKTFGLDEFDTEALSFAIRKVTAGEVFIGDGVDLIANEAGLPRERAKNLLGLMVNEVLVLALEDIKKIQAAKFPQRFVAATPSQVQTSIERSEPTRNNANPNVIDLRNKPN